MLTAQATGQGKLVWGWMMRKRSFCNDASTTDSFLPGTSGGALLFQRPLERLPIGQGVQDAVQASRVGMIGGRTGESHGTNIGISHPAGAGDGSLILVTTYQHNFPCSAVTTGGDEGTPHTHHLPYTILIRSYKLLEPMIYAM